ncbi:MAG: AAA family ATPase [Acidimicrobiia bacterium]
MIKGRDSPALVCFTGPPGAGKSVLARAVSEQLQIPLFDRDVFKDLLFDTLGWSDRDWSRKLSRASWVLLDSVASTLIAHGITVILDSNFKPSDQIAEHLLALTEQHGVARVEIHLRADVNILYDRYRSRFLAGERHPGHVAFDTTEEFGNYFNDTIFAPLGFRSLMELDTTRSWPEVGTVVSWLAGQLSPDVGTR